MINRISRRFIFKGSLTFFAVCLTAAHAAPITWVAQNPNNDMNDPASWNPSTVPGSTDTAVFDSTLSGISFTPTSTATPFTVSSFQFINQASPFNFHFNNSPLEFDGTGIIGSQTNCTINATNINSSGLSENLVAFLGPTGSAGSAHIISSNSATLTGNQSNKLTGNILSNVYSSGAFTIANGGSIVASNLGNDSTTGSDNSTVNVARGQLRFDQSFTAGSNVSVSASNEGIFSGTTINKGHLVAIVDNSQFNSADAFQVGDNFICQLTNTGNDSALGGGDNMIGELRSAQMLLQTTATFGNNCSVTLSNTGLNSSQTTGSDFVGYLNDQQFFVGSTLQAGNNFALTVMNTGTDTSQGFGGSQVAVINSNSGTTGQQVLLQHGCTLGNHATFNVSNQGTYSGTNTNGGSNVALMNLQQIAIGDFNAPGSFAFNAGDNLILTVSSVGSDSANGRGSDAVGTVSTDQVTFYTPCTIGNNANITMSKSGDYSGNATTTFVNVGSAGGSQLNCASTFHAGDNFNLNITNSGTHTGSGVGSNFIGDIITGQQAFFGLGLTLGDQATLTISNSGSDSSNTLNQNQTGTLLGYGKQLLIKDAFQAGDNLTVVITNSGMDASTGSGGNYTGFINNNVADQSASQFQLDGPSIVGNDANITISNSGTYQGSNTNGNLVGLLAGQQFNTPGAFQAGDHFSLEATNSGLSQASGQSNHKIGTISNRGQMAFGNSCTLGDNASILLANHGINHDATGLSNTIGYVNGSQFNCAGTFSAGKNLTLTATNTSVNDGDSSNQVGQINGFQINFQQSCLLNDGALISAFNSGTVANSQILFAQGFNLVSGKAMIQAINEFTVGGFGIDVQGTSLGGDVAIALQNSSLYIATTSPLFTIGGLSGDSTSTVQSQPVLVIQTDAATSPIFSGTIKDFPAISSQLMKTGPGTQTLSGINTYSGLTTVQEGALILNGSLAGDVLINPLGTLKGIGTIGGTLTNTGTVSPGESIGQITVLSTYINNNGTYAVEVNGAGQSDLIDVSGNAVINGGIVAVSSVDGTFSFQKPYTIVTADGGVEGRYSQVTALGFVTPTLSYDANHVYLTLVSDLLRAAARCNQFGVARNLDNIIGPNAAQSLLISNIASLPLSAAQEALESLSGFQYTNEIWVTEIYTRRFLRRLYDPLRSLVNRCTVPGDCPCGEWMAWLETGGGVTHLHGKHAHRLHASNYEVTGGLQASFCCNLTIGLAGSYEHEHLKYRDGRGKRQASFIAVYGLYRPSAFYGLFDLSYGHSCNHLKRHILAGRVQDKVQGKPRVTIPTFYGEVGIDLWEKNCFLVQPFFGIQAGKNRRHRINEKHHAEFALSINKQNWTTTSSRLGLHLSVCRFCDCVDAALDLAWNERLSHHKNQATGRFQRFGSAFPICGNPLDRSSVDYALTVKGCLCAGFKGYIELSGEAWQHASTFDALAGIQFSW